MQLWMGILSRLLRRSLLVLEIRESERNSSLCGGELWIPIFAAPWRKFARLPRGRWKPFAGLEKQTVCFEAKPATVANPAVVVTTAELLPLQRPCLPPFTLELQKMHLQLTLLLPFLLALALADHFQTLAYKEIQFSVSVRNVKYKKIGRKFRKFFVESCSQSCLKIAYKENMKCLENWSKICTAFTNFFVFCVEIFC